MKLIASTIIFFLLSVLGQEYDVPTPQIVVVPAPVPLPQMGPAPEPIVPTPEPEVPTPEPEPECPDCFTGCGMACYGREEACMGQCAVGCTPPVPMWLAFASEYECDETFAMGVVEKVGAFLNNPCAVGGMCHMGGGNGNGGGGDGNGGGGGDGNGGGAQLLQDGVIIVVEIHLMSAPGASAAENALALAEAIRDSNDATLFGAGSPFLTLNDFDIGFDMGSCEDICLAVSDRQCPIDQCCAEETNACLGDGECSASVMADGDGAPSYIGEAGSAGETIFNDWLECASPCFMECEGEFDGGDPSCFDECMTPDTCANEAMACSQNQNCLTAFMGNVEAECFGVWPFEEEDQYEAADMALFDDLNACLEPCTTETCGTNLFTFCSCTNYCMEDIIACGGNDGCAAQWASVDMCFASQSDVGCWDDSYGDDGEAEYRIAYGCLGNCVKGGGPSLFCPEFYGWDEDDLEPWGLERGDLCQDLYLDCLGEPGCLSTILAVAGTAENIPMDVSNICNSNYIGTAGDRVAQTNTLFDCAIAVTEGSEQPVIDQCDEAFLRLADLAGCWVDCGTPDPYSIRDICEGSDGGDGGDGGDGSDGGDGGDGSDDSKDEEVEGTSALSVTFALIIGFVSVFLL